uniref:Uncharacterized protein n=1 Tax=Meloidogyne enterolobii TaxID=390850 RepID=A0A6V7U8A4_MELEN|nr:unnamed protein product [Meloidogyne enterolobii]
MENYYLNKKEFKFEKWQQILQINIIQYLLNLPTFLQNKDIKTYKDWFDRVKKLFLKENEVKNNKMIVKHHLQIIIT